MSSGKLTHSTGYKREAADHPLKLAHPFAPVRSRMMGAALSPANTDYEINDSLVLIFDQLQEESCVANAWTADLMILLALELGVAPPVLARQFAYWTFRCVNGEQGADNGTELSSGAQALSTSGICEENLWPYDPANVLVSPPEQAFFQASQNLLKAYYALTDTGTQLGNDIESCIRANHPVPFGAQIGMELDEYQGANASPSYVFEPPAAIEGGHGLLIVGVRYVAGKRQWKIRNSWNKTWGLGGYFWMAEDYLLSDYCSDFWTATRLDNLVV